VVLEQAESRAAFDRSDRVRNRFYFSHLYTAIDQIEFRRFLGLKDGELRRNPVPKARMRELREFMTWLYGRQSRNVQPLILSQNPDLNFLREVVGHSSALASLRRGSSLERAYQVSIGDERRFRDAINAAKEDLQYAKATVTTGYRGEPDLQEIMEDVSLLVSSIDAEMKSIADRRVRRSKSR
jgi:hypothetical protein